MRLLFWLCPLASGCLTTLHMVENIAYNNSYLFYYSYCGKTTFYPEVIYRLIIANLCTSLTTLSIIAELFAHICIYIKKRSVENRAQVYEIRGNRLVSEMRHQRNVVSALGHFLSFLLSLTQRIILTLSLYSIKDDTIVLLARLTHFMLPCINFFVHPLIETMSSHHLRGSIFTLRS